MQITFILYHSWNIYYNNKFKKLKNENNYEINFALTFAGKKLPLSKCTKCDVSFKLRGWAENFFYKNNAQGGK